MRELYILIGDFPAQVIFSLSLVATSFGDKSKLDLYGYRWAPRSFLESSPTLSGGLTEEDDRWVRCSGDGLCGTYCGFIFDNIEDTAYTPFIATDHGSNNRYTIVCQPRLEEERLLWRGSCDRIAYPSQAALLFDDVDPDYSFRRVLGTIEHEEGDVLSFRCLARGQNRNPVDGKPPIYDA